MENIEIIFKDIYASDIKKIFKWFLFKEENIKSSHFFEDGKDITYQELSNIEAYFNKVNTGQILIENIDIGTKIDEAIIIISFDNNKGDLTINFEETENFVNDFSEDILLKINEIKFIIHYSNIIFGYEPSEDEDMLVFKI